MGREHKSGMQPDERHWLSAKFGVDALFDEPLAGFTSLRVGGPADALIRVRDKAGLSELIAWAGDRKQPYYVFGGGTNLLVKDQGVRGVVIMLSGAFQEMHAHTEADNSLAVSAGAGAKLAALCSFAISKGLAGLNFATGIPGTVGGAISMNAGTHAGCMADAVKAVRFATADAGEVCLAAHQLAWEYRKMTPPLPEAPGRAPVIYKGLFNVRPGDKETLRQERNALIAQRKRSQPRGVKSGGSFFKNPPDGESAGALIDKAGLKGASVGGAQVSPVHANWIVNTGRATASDILNLMELIQDKVLSLFGVALEPEVKIIDA